MIEKTDDHRMVILQNKKNISSVPKGIIEKYENIVD